MVQPGVSVAKYWVQDFAKDDASMTAKAYIIAMLLSSIMWVTSFDVAQHAYRHAQKAGAIPNLHLKETAYRWIFDDDAGV
ncbi:hypothetical protein QD460_20305 [Rhizobium jaguaris]|uniref:Uncharacterized protein n=1 Tax=Rhizobium jaguaris TaxID=1312183 RepID=A0A387FZL7_9HYPH|nr:hypothetical protein [Rhizobium jaguaris]AYG62655.1 hypothetical protein CCGE525_28310 [Rhizobium jaguaris]